MCFNRSTYILCISKNKLLSQSADAHKIISRNIIFMGLSRYTGEFKNCEKHGHGIYQYSDGRRYGGAWKNNLREGKGIYSSANDGSIYDGNWEKGKMNGYGHFTYSPMGSEYCGNWKDGLKHGQGKFVFPDGRICEGEWKDNCFLGDIKPAPKKL